MFYLGMLVGFVIGSILWILYISYWIEEAESLGRRARKWFQKVFRLPRDQK